MNHTELDDQHDLDGLRTELRDLAARWQVAPAPQRPDLVARHARFRRGRQLVPILVGAAMLVVALFGVGWVASRFQPVDPVAPEPTESGLLEGLDQVPLEFIGDLGVALTWGDYARATELTGMARPTIDDSFEEQVAWLGMLGGDVQDHARSADTVESVWASPWYVIEMDQRLDDLEGIHDELGWTFLDVDQVVAVNEGGWTEVGDTILGSPLKVVTGPAANAPLPSSLATVEGGLLRAGPATEPYSLEDSTAARLQGAPLWMARADARMAVSTSRPAIEAWLAGPPSALEDPSIERVATALATTEPLSATIVRGAFSPPGPPAGPDLEPNELLPAPVEAAGMAWSLDDVGPVLTVAYLHPSVDDAAANLEVMDRVWEPLTEPFEGAGFDDTIEFESAEADGELVIVRVRPVGAQASAQVDLQLRTGLPPFATQAAS